MGVNFQRSPFIDCVVDLQYGSTGKGLFCYYLAQRKGYDTVASVNMPNAGHTVVMDNGDKVVFKVLPTSALSRHVRRVMIGPGAVINLGQLDREMKMLDKFNYDARVFIHENAWILEAQHVQAEFGQGLGSTRSGAGVALISKITRGHGSNINNAKYWETRIREDVGAFVLNHRDWGYMLDHCTNVLLEGSQGYSLSINGPFYPYTTSRDCTPARFFSDAMFPVQMLRQTYGVMRTYPIRVGGDSGPWYTGQEETTWAKLGVKPEYTTVTNRERRVADFSAIQIEEAVRHCMPDDVFLNFANYNEEYAYEIAGWYNKTFAPESCVRWLGYGPSPKDIVHYKSVQRRGKPLRSSDGV